MIADDSILINLFEKKTIIRFAYLFGSCTTGKHGPLSDLDIAIFLDDDADYSSCRLIFMEELSCEPGGGRTIDLEVLNEAHCAPIRNNPRRNSAKEDRERREEFETHVLREYSDTEPLRIVHRAALKRSFGKEHHPGESLSPLTPLFAMFAAGGKEWHV